MGHARARCWIAPLLTVALLSACNSLLGLEGTQLAARDACAALDRDCDGVADSIDTCPDVANSDQIDDDRDGLGDACDPCTWAHDPGGDDDQDGITNDLDRCPANRGTAQPDADGDQVGDACDPQANVANTLTCFSDFSPTAASNALAVWALEGTGWRVDTVNSQLTSSSTAGTGPTPIVSTRVPVHVPGGAGVAEDVSVAIGLSSTYAVGVGIAVPGGPSMRCVARSTNGTQLLVSLLAGDGSVLTERVLSQNPLNAGITAVRLIAEPSAAGTDVRCGITIGTTVTEAPAFAMAGVVSGDLTIQLVADLTLATFRNVALYTTQ